MTARKGNQSGFAAMIATGRTEEMKAISSKGGKACHVMGTAHEWTTEQAREAGRKGGKATAAKKRAAKVAATLAATNNQETANAEA